jgi:hypothetical protein
VTGHGGFDFIPTAKRPPRNSPFADGHASLAAFWREYFRAVPVQSRMKTKLLSMALVVAAAGFVAGGCGYLVWLNSRTQSLEARLARVEAALNANNTTGAWTAAAPAALARQGAAPLLQIPRVLPLGRQRDSLERRVEKIEQELTPHFELLPLARPAAPGVTR